MNRTLLACCTIAALAHGALISPAMPWNRIDTTLPPNDHHRKPSAIIPDIKILPAPEEPSLDPNQDSEQADEKRIEYTGLKDYLTAIPSSDVLIQYVPVQPPRPTDFRRDTRWIIPSSRPDPGVTNRPKNDPFFNSSDLDENPFPRHAPAPDYPFHLANQHIEGQVMALLHVDAKGNVVSVKIENSSNMDFEPSALEALAKWKFYKGMRKGQPVPFKIRVPLQFTLE